MITGLLAVVFGIFRFYLISRFPTDENLFENSPDGVVIIDILKGGASDRAGLKVGDIILRINDKTFKDSFGADRIMKEGEPGTVMVYRILRSGQEMEVSVALAAYGFEIRLLAFFVAMLGFAVFAVFLGVFRPEDKSARLLSSGFMLYALIAFSGVTLNRPEGATEIVAAALFGLGLPLAAATNIHAYHFFPEPKKYLLSRSWVTKATYGYFAFVAVVFLFVTFGPFEGLTSRLAAFGIFFLGLAGTGLISFFLRKERTEDEKIKSAYIRYTGFGILILFLVLIAASLLIDVRIGLYVQYALFVLVLIPASHFYTIVKFRLYDVNFVVKRSFVYGLLSFAITVLFLVVILIGIRLLPSVEIMYPSIFLTEESIEITGLTLAKDSAIEKSVLMVLAVILAAVLWRFRKWVQQGLDRKFYKESYDYRLVLSEFSELFASLVNIEALYHGLVTKLATIMNLKAVGIMLVEKGHLKGRAMTGFSEKPWRRMEFGVNQDWVIQLIHREKPTPVERIDEKSKDRLLEINAYFIAPIVINEKILGILILGEKLSESNYTVEDVSFLHALSQQAAVALENARLYGELSEKERLKNELNMARKIQIGLLPHSFPQITDLDISAACIPAVEVGGDYYDFFRNHDHDITVVVGDVSGKGTSAALYMSKMQGIMRSIYEYQHSTRDFFIKTNDLISREADRNFFVTMAGIRFDLKKRQTALVRAGHLPIIHYVSGKSSCEIVQPAGIGLCLSDNGLFEAHLEESQRQFEKNDIFVLVTDGITESPGPDGTDFELEGIIEVIRKNPEQSSSWLRDQILESVRSFRGSDDPFDDLTVVVIKIR